MTDRQRFDGNRYCGACGGELPASELYRRRCISCRLLYGSCCQTHDGIRCKLCDQARVEGQPVSAGPAPAPTAARAE